MRFARPAVPLLAAALVAAAGSAASAQEGKEEPAPPLQPEKGKVTIVPKEGGYKIEELFDAIHRATGISILYQSNNATFKQAKVEFVGRHVIREDELFSWLQSVLSYQKLVLVPVGPTAPDGTQQWFVMDQADPNLKTRPVYVAEDSIEEFADRDGLYIVTTLTLEYISDTTRVRNALSPLSTPTAGIGRIQDIPGSRALIVGDFAPVVVAMKRLLRYIDVENPRIEPRMEVIQLNFAVASELEPIISDLIQAADVGQARAPRQPGTPEEEPEPKIIADNRLDALIVYATEQDMAKIRALVERLDVPSQARGRLHFRALKHTDAEELAKLLDDLISETSDRSAGTFGGRSSSRSTTRRTPTTGGQPSPGGGGALGGSGVEGAPVIIADTKSNSLIIQASPTQFDVIDELIARLDQARPQVLIETSLVELGLSDQLQLGVELFSADEKIAVDTDGNGEPDAITDERAFFGNTGFGLTDLVTQDVGGVLVPVNKSPILGTGFTAGIFDNGRLPIVLSAFQSSGRAKILTMPSLVTNDNEQAKLEIVRKTSYLENVRSDTGQDRDSYKEVEARSTLTISPHISSDNYLRLEIEQTLSNFGTRPSPNAPPDQIERTISTNVTLPDTYTVVLGGVVSEEERTTVSKVPFLGDIPILGFFFRQTDDQSSPQHLFLFVTPRILRDTETFTEYHKLSWEKKLLQDDLFGSEVLASNTRFRGPVAPESAEEKLRRLEESGELDAGRLKAPLTEEERVRLAAEEARRRAARQPAEKPVPPEQPAPPPEPAPPQEPAPPEKPR